MKQSFLSLAILALAGASLTFGQDTKTSGKLNSADAQFVRDVQASGHHEIEMAQLALKRSTDAQVKSLAQRLVNDHTAAGKKLEEVAKMNGLLLTSAATEARKDVDTRTDDNKHVDSHIETMQGADFDKAWAKQMIEDHKAAIAKFEGEQKEAKNADLQSFVSTALPTLREHLAQAQALDK
jgi:putative membrane protein